MTDADLRFSQLASDWNKRRFCILTQGRAGSTLLCSLLDSHPQIHCDIAEPLQTPRPDFMEWLEMESRAATTDVWGFKVKPDQLRANGMDPAAFVRTITANGWDIIHNVRANKFRQALSNEVLHSRKREGLGAYSLTGQNYIGPIHVDPGHLLERMETRARMDNEDQDALGACDSRGLILRASYENLQSLRSRAFSMVMAFRFLGVDPDHLATTPFHKVTPPDWRDAVANADEIAAAVHGHKRFAHMLGMD